MIKVSLRETMHADVTCLCRTLNLGHPARDWLGNDSNKMMYHDFSSFLQANNAGILS
jgi:hypothetical protein